jgi:potassium-dependent mechanosensitive channel
MCNLDHYKTGAPYFPLLKQRFYRLGILFFIIPIGIYLSIDLIEFNIKNAFSTSKYGPSLSALLSIIDVTYYYLPSFLITFLLKIEVLDRNDTTSKIKIPNIILLFIQILIFFIPSVFVLLNIFSVDLTGILATSGMLSIILGLAIQPNLSNVLSGLFVNIEHPFAPNDWITINNNTGQVIDISWRSTRLRTFENTEVTIPNEIVAQSVLTNWDRPDKEKSEGYQTLIYLSFHPSHEPQFIKQLLYDALEKVKPIDGRLALGLQWAGFIDVDEYGLKFGIKFDCTDRSSRAGQTDAVLMEIHKTMRHSGVTMTAGRIITHAQEDVGLKALRNELQRKPDDFEPHLSGQANPYNESIKNKVLIQKVPIFNTIRQSDIELIAQNSVRKKYEKSEYIVTQNDSSKSLFIIADGVVSVQLSNGNDSQSEIAKLGVGDFFGEMSLMTGKLRTADIISLRPTLVLEIKKSIMESIIKNNANFSDQISLVLAERQAELSNARLSSDKKSEEVKKLSSEIKAAILRFFR